MRGLQILNLPPRAREAPFSDLMRVFLQDPARSFQDEPFGTQ